MVYSLMFILSRVCLCMAKLVYKSVAILVLR